MQSQNTPGHASALICLDNLRRGAVILANSGVYLLAARPVPELLTDRRLNYLTRHTSRTKDYRETLQIHATLFVV